MPKQLIETPLIGFTQDNFCAVADPRSPNPKTETRRLLALPKMSQEFTNRVKVIFEDVDGFVAYSPDEYNLRFVMQPKYRIGDRYSHLSITNKRR